MRTRRDRQGDRGELLDEQLVSIDPMLIGVPVAGTPGLGPQDEVETVPAAAGLDAAGAEAAALLLPPLAGVLAAAAEELLLDELELQPATTPVATADDGGCRPGPPVDESIHGFCLLVANSGNFLGTSAWLRASGTLFAPPGAGRSSRRSYSQLNGAPLHCFAICPELVTLDYVHAACERGPVAENGLVTFGFPRVPHCARCAGLKLTTGDNRTAALGQQLHQTPN